MALRVFVMAIRRASVTNPISKQRTSGGIVIDIDEAMVTAILSELRHMPRNMKKAQVSAINRTLNTAETKIKQKVAGGKGVTTLASKEAASRIFKKKRPSEMSPSGVLAISDRKINLFKYGGSKADIKSQKGLRISQRKPRQGAGWRVYKDEKKIRRKNFFATYTKKGKGPYIMKRSMSSKRGGKRAIPGNDYRIAYGPSIVDVMEDKKIFGPTINELRLILKQNLESQVDRFLKRKKNA